MNTSDEEELRTLEADLRTALQQQRAEYERVREMQSEIEALMERARTLIAAKEADAAMEIFREPRTEVDPLDDTRQGEQA